jgi:uncharacterized protein (TIGR00645 family)
VINSQRIKSNGSQQWAGDASAGKTRTAFGMGAVWVALDISAPLSINGLMLAAIFVVFLRQLMSQLPHLWTMESEEVILLTLSFIDLSLTANLLLIVIFAGYENFVSKIHVGDGEDRPAWMGTVDFSGLKIKLIASIVAISAIALGV